MQEPSAAGFDLQDRLRHKLGGYLVVDDRGYFFQGAAGGADRMVGLLVDVTERRPGS